VVSEYGTQVGIARARAGSIVGPHVDADRVMSILADIPDPELPVVSIVELGMIHRVEIAPGDGPIRVTVLPTFVGCPAIELIRSSIADRLAGLGRPVEVITSFEVPWTTDRISPAGRLALARAGIAPPGPSTDADEGPATLIQLEPRVTCPHCGSRDTALENAFGPTPCRTIRFCRGCRQPFEAIKPV
jgi:ring-1,2-phenylacetyl-CoA epoxidase subunit PaaD